MGIARSAAVLLMLFAGVATAEPSPALGARIAAFYDSLDVERLWLPGRRADWKTGAAGSPRKGVTHCSALVAAATLRLGVDMLRPPEHGTVVLANAQAGWLASDGAAHGWRPVDSPFEAQRLANQGEIVVAAYAEPDPKKPGHIAFVRPAEKNETAISAEGPQLIQAGMVNASSIPLKDGFSHHRGAWRSGSDFKVRFYAHPLPSGALGP